MTDFTLTPPSVDNSAVTDTTQVDRQTASFDDVSAGWRTVGKPPVNGKIGVVVLPQYMPENNLLYIPPDERVPVTGEYVNADLGIAVTPKLTVYGGDTNPNPGLSVGLVAGGTAMVNASGGLFLRTNPTTSADTLLLMPYGATVTVVAASANADGYDWWLVRYNGQDGYCAGMYLTAYSTQTGTTQSVLAVGGSARVIADNLSLRSSAGIDAPLVVTMPLDTVVTLLAGPQQADNYNWWKASYSGREGWCAGEFLQALVSTAATPGSTAQVAGTGGVGVRIRSQPSTSATQLGTAPDGATVQTTGEYSSDGARVWWKVSYNGVVGWAAGDYLVGVSTANGGGTTTATVTATDSLRLRDSPGTASTTLTVMPSGATATVIGGPQTANSIVWWQLNYGALTGWAAATYLTLTTATQSAASSATTTPATTTIGTVTADSLNLRATASTSGTVVTILSYGAVVTITGSSTQANGITWLPVSYNGFNGWVASDSISTTTAGSTTNISSTATMTRPKILLSAGHRNTAERGNTLERGLNLALAVAYRTELTQAGYDVTWVQEVDGDTLPTETEGDLTTVVMLLHELIGATADNVLLLDLHHEWSSGRGLFAIVPDKTGLTSALNVPQASGDTWANNTTARAVGQKIVTAISNKTGLPLRTGNVIQPGLMSEGQSGVAGSGWRLGVFAATSEYYQRATRLVIEHGNMNNADDMSIINASVFATRCAQGCVEALNAYYGTANTTTTTTVSQVTQVKRPGGSVGQNIGPTIQQPREDWPESSRLPLVNFGGHRVAVKNQPITFTLDFAQQDNDGAIVTGNWNIRKDDAIEATGSGFRFTHTFATSGLATVTCTVNGQSSSRYVRVLDFWGQSDLDVVGIGGLSGTTENGWTLSLTVKDTLTDLDPYQGILLYVYDDLDVGWRDDYDLAMRVLSRQTQSTSELPPEPLWETTYIGWSEGDAKSFTVVPEQMQVVSGVVTSATATSVSDTVASWTTNQWQNYLIKFTSGAAEGLIAPITGNNATELSLGTTLAVIPNSSTKYELVKAAADRGCWPAIDQYLNSYIEGQARFGVPANLMRALAYVVSCGDPADLFKLGAAFPARDQIRQTVLAMARNYRSCKSWPKAIAKYFTSYCGSTETYNPASQMGKVLDRWQEADDLGGYGYAKAATGGATVTTPGVQYGEVLFAGYLDSLTANQTANESTLTLNCISSAQMLGKMMQRVEWYWESPEWAKGGGTVIGLPMRTATCAHHLLTEHTNFPAYHDVVLDWSGPRFWQVTAPEGTTLAALQGWSKNDYAWLFADRGGRLRHIQRPWYRGEMWYSKALREAIRIDPEYIMEYAVTERTLMKRTSWTKLCGTVRGGNCEVCGTYPCNGPVDGNAGEWQVVRGLRYDDDRTLCAYAAHEFAYQNRAFDIQMKLPWRHDLELGDLIYSPLASIDGRFDWSQEISVVFVITAITHTYDTAAASWLTDITAEQLTFGTPCSCAKSICPTTRNTGTCPGDPGCDLVIADNAFQVERVSIKRGQKGESIIGHDTGRRVLVDPNTGVTTSEQVAGETLSLVTTTTTATSQAVSAGTAERAVARAAYIRESYRHDQTTMTSEELQMEIPFFDLSVIAPRVAETVVELGISAVDTAHAVSRIMVGSNQIAITSDEEVSSVISSAAIVLTGQADSGTAFTLVDEAVTWGVDQFAGLVLRLTGGTGAGQTRTIRNNGSKTIWVTTAFSPAPDNTTTYQVTLGADVQVGDETLLALPPNLRPDLNAFKGFVMSEVAKIEQKDGQVRKVGTSTWSQKVVIPVQLQTNPNGVTYRVGVVPTSQFGGETWDGSSLGIDPLVRDVRSYVIKSLSRPVYGNLPCSSLRPAMVPEPWRSAWLSAVNSPYFSTLSAQLCQMFPPCCGVVGNDISNSVTEYEGEDLPLGAVVAGDTLITTERRRMVEGAQANLKIEVTCASCKNPEAYTTTSNAGNSQQSICPNWPTAAAINMQIAKAAEVNPGKPNPLSGYGNKFVQWGHTYGINPGIIAAISQRECQLGCDGSRLPTEANNFGGHTTSRTGAGPCGSIAAADRLWKQYCNVDEGAEALFKWFDDPFYRNLGNRLVDVMQEYSPPFENPWTGYTDSNGQYVRSIWEIFARVGESLGISITKESIFYTDMTTCTPVSGSSDSSGASTGGYTTKFEYVMRQYNVSISQGPCMMPTHRAYECDCYDFSIPIGTPLYPIFPGKVTFAGPCPAPYNPNQVTVETSYGSIIYAHLSEVYVTVGQQVTGETLLGRTGTAGTGPHLHFGLIGSGCQSYFANGTATKLTQAMQAIGFNFGTIPKRY